jgi:hypothetical protein
MWDELTGITRFAPLWAKSQEFISVRCRAAQGEHYVDP